MIYFFKGKQNVLKKDKTTEEKMLLKELQDSFNKILDGKNLSFLLGCGTSSHREEDEEIGIPTMQPLANEFYKDVLTSDLKTFLLKNLSRECKLNCVRSFLMC